MAARPETRGRLAPLVQAALVAACLLAAPPAAAQEIAAQRVQLAERLAWQWVPPESRVLGGCRIDTPGHWHRRGEPCLVCGDYMSRPGGVAQANPQLLPAAPPPQAATSQYDERFARLAAELADLKDAHHGWSTLDARLVRQEQTAAAHAAALEAALPALERIDQRVAQLGAAVERLGLRLSGVETTQAEDRAALRERIRELVAPLVAAALGESGSAGQIAIALEGLAVGGPIGLGVVAGGMLIAAALRRRRAAAGRGTAGAGEAPAPDPFPAAGGNPPPGATAPGDHHRGPAAAPADGDGADLRAL